MVDLFDECDFGSRCASSRHTIDGKSPFVSAGVFSSFQGLVSARGVVSALCGAFAG